VVREHVDKAGVAELVVDNPPVNAYNLADIAALVGHLRGYASDPRVRAVVLRGEGRGFCIGLGVLVAGVCDILLAAPGTPFVLAEADNGATSGVVQASALMPDKRLRAAMFTCEPVQSDELLGYGSVLRLVPADELPEAARALATTIAGKRTNVIRGLKAAMAGSIGRNIRDAYRQEVSYTLEHQSRGR
jgi:enoyl-CoA hydratase